MTNPAQSLEEYYDFVSHCETSMPLVLIRLPEYPEILDHTNEKAILILELAISC